MEQFEIPVKFVMHTTWTIEANSEAEAKEKAKDMLDVIDRGFEIGEIVDVYV